MSVFRNDGTSFAQPPARIPATDLAVHAAAADLNLDGKIDLAVAATGFEVLRGQGSVTSFEEGEDFVAGRAFPRRGGGASPATAVRTSPS